MTDRDRCALCGNVDPRDITTSLAHWREAPQGMAYEHVVRCRDVSACRARVHAQKKTWSLVETMRERAS